VRICIVYDLLYPETVGGAERWYRNVALRLADDGHDVTYLTMRSWDAAEPPDLPNVQVVAVARQMPLYTGGRRRILPALVFGLGVLWHLLRCGRRYDVVHTASFPYFSLLAAAFIRPFAGYRIVVDWHEFWTRDYWREYLGALRGWFGWQVQELCLHVPQRAFCFSRLVERRLVADGVPGGVTVLEGQFDGTPAREPLPAEPMVVFAGRHIPEKNPVAVVHAVAKARQTIPDLRGAIYGDGPERPKVLAAIAEHGLEGVVEAPGFVDEGVIENALARALCLVLPSRREGYGLVVIETLAMGTPVLLVCGEDNASTELIEDGVNGLVVASAAPDELARAIGRVHQAGSRLRETTLAALKNSAGRLALASSLEKVVLAYGADSSAAS
jgi:glycosyltransferase involved in cell wall biosynthesis